MAPAGDQVGTQTLFPVIRYRDPDAAIEWLGRAFGLTERVVHRDDSGNVMHAELELGDGTVMIGHADPSGWMGGGPPQPLASTVSLYAVIEDPDAHHDRAVAAGATVVRELTDQSYGSREYSARDLEGNLWSFGTYRPHD
ncbi:MAG TPA: VOC family protein [Solirubrobacterales bacterium]|jgi:uncharacterized glyoxalase superfamily protein PhnB